MRLALVLTGATLLAACAGVGLARGPDSAGPSPLPAPPPILTPYIDTLARMAPGDPARQTAELEAALVAARQSRTSTDVLRYALALGCAGHASSNPVEAKRLISELLASPNTLDANETTLAQAYLREFDARVALYAELARHREETQQKLESLDATADRRTEVLAAENRQLKRKLADAERKLEAVAEMERLLLEQAGSQTEPPQRP